MPRDEVDDTDMTPAAFRAAQAAGQRVRVVGSRAEFQASMDLNAPQPKPYVLNKYVSLAFSGMTSLYSSTPVRWASAVNLGKAVRLSSIWSLLTSGLAC